IYRGLPFTAVIDYAHNPDGMSRLVEFIDGIEVSGRKLVLLAGTGSRSNEIIDQSVGAAAGHFDHYVCRSYPDLRGRAYGEVPALVRQSLLDAGVADANITVCKNPAKALNEVLEMAREEDLVVLLLNREEFSEVHQRLSSLRNGVD
ncbi:MAG: hypothetical protein HKO64_11025, partial [Xanthomonadales bacterium]|nr:hypothetical protein [Xanthomonadales bacterium]